LTTTGSYSRNGDEPKRPQRRTSPRQAFADIRADLVRAAPLEQKKARHPNLQTPAVLPKAAAHSPGSLPASRSCERTRHTPRDHPSATMPQRSPPATGKQLGDPLTASWSSNERPRANVSRDVRGLAPCATSERRLCLCVVHRVLLVSRNRGSTGDRYDDARHFRTRTNGAAPAHFRHWSCGRRSNARADAARARRKPVRRHVPGVIRSTFYIPGCMSVGIRVDVSNSSGRVASGRRTGRRRLGRHLPRGRAVAMQQGRYVGSVVRARLEPTTRCRSTTTTRTTWRRSGAGLW
jgi:hypothetical protein